MLRLSRGSFLVQLQWRHWREPLGLVKPGNSFQALIGAWLPQVDLEVPLLLPVPALHHRSTPWGVMAPGDLHKDWLGTFAPLPAYHLGNPELQALPTAPPGPLGAGGPAIEAFRLAVCYYSHSCSVTGLLMLRTPGWSPP